MINDGFSGKIFRFRSWKSIEIITCIHMCMYTLYLRVTMLYKKKRQNIENFEKKVGGSAEKESALEGADKQIYDIYTYITF